MPLKELVPNVPQKMRDGLSNGVHRFGKETAAEWKQRVHVISGEFRDSITYNILSPTSGEVSSDKIQAVVEEFGSKYRPPHPSLTPLMEERSQQLPQVVNEEVIKTLK